MRKFIFLAVLAASFDVHAQRIDVDVQDERQRDSYMVAMDIAAGLKPVKDDVDVRIVAQTLVDLMVDGKQPLLTNEEALTTRKAFMAKVQARKKK